MNSSHPVPYPILDPRKKPQTSQVYYYLNHYTPQSILSALERLTCHTSPYDFLHLSWRNNIYSSTPFTNDLNTILTFYTHPLLSSHMHPPITIQMNRVKYLSFTFRILILIAHTNKRLCVILFIHTFTNTYIILFYATFYITST